MGLWLRPLAATLELEGQLAAVAVALVAMRCVLCFPDHLAARARLQRARLAAPLATQPAAGVAAVGLQQLQLQQMAGREGRVVTFWLVDRHRWALLPAETEAATLTWQPTKLQAAGEEAAAHRPLLATAATVATVVSMAQAVEEEALRLMVLATPALAATARKELSL